MEIQIVALQGSADPLTFASTVTALSNPSGLPLAYANSHIPFGETDLVNQSTPGVPPTPPGVPILKKTLNEDFDGYGRLIQRFGTDQKLYSDSFGRNYDDAPTETANVGDMQIWDVYNTTGDTHPIHFHLVNVQVIGRAEIPNFDPDHPAVVDFTTAPSFNNGPDPNEKGWKEMVRMNPGEVTRVIMKFALPSVSFAVPVSPRTGGNEYVWHCHILEHEEHDMMRPLVVKS
jgi:spore coat protein A